MNAMEKVACNLCGSEESINYFPIPSGMLVKCKECGLFYSNPRKTLRLIHSAKGKVIAPELLQDKIEEREISYINFAKKLQKLEKHYPQERKGKLLDVGCYAGFFLKIAKDAGWHVYGVEPNWGGSEYARQKLGLNVITSTLEEAIFPNGYFDVVTLYAVLEHVPDPSSLLKEINRVLRKGGLIALEVPTIDNLWFRALKRKWRHFILGHFYFFTKDTITLLLQRLGFEVLETDLMGKYVSTRLITRRIKEKYSSVLGGFFELSLGKLNLMNRKIWLNFRDLLVVYGIKQKDISYHENPHA